MSSTIPILDLFDETWLQVRDGNLTAWALHRRHYSSRENNKSTRFVGPGARIVLITSDGLALFIWRKFIDDSGQVGVNCAAFRNEGPHLSSELILKAERWALERWPNERLYTYVNASEIKSSNAGYCFKKAGWNKCGTTKKRRLIILEKNDYI